MKRAILLTALTTCMMTLSACGAYVGAPPKSEVHETTTTTPQPDVVHVYTQ